MSRFKHIAIHSNTLWSLSNFRYELIKSLIEKGYKVSCIAAKDDISNKSISRLASIKSDVFPIKMDRKGMNPINEISYIFRLRRVLKRIKPEVVLFYTPKPNIFGSITCRILRIPFINTINGLGSGFSSQKKLAIIIKYLYRFALKKSSGIYIHNQDDLKFFVNENISKQNITHYIPGSGVNTNLFMPADNQAKRYRALNILYAGRLIREKGIIDFIDMARSLKSLNPECNFSILGFIDEGNPSSLNKCDLEKLSKEGVVEYLGKSDNIVKFLNSSDILVFPSTYNEGLPRILLEASSCALPLITYNVPGCRDLIINNYNGFLCESGNKEELIRTCQMVINMSISEIDTLGKNARKRVIDGFSVDKVNRYYLQAIQKILEN